jgi:Bacterial antitoxin of type II TA system, VapB
MVWQLRLTQDSIPGMARQKATITLDRRKVDEARQLTGQKSTSAVIDLALERLVRSERLRRDIEAYRRTPLGDDELVIGDLPVELDLDDGNVEYEKYYGKRK